MTKKYCFYRINIWDLWAPVVKFKEKWQSAFKMKWILDQIIKQNIINPLIMDYKSWNSDDWKAPMSGRTEISKNIWKKILN